MMANPPRRSSNVAVSSNNKNEFPSSNNDGGNAVDELLDSLQFTELDKERSKHLVNSLRKFEHEGTGDPHLLLKNLYDADDLQHIQLNEKEESLLDLLKDEVKDYIERSEQRFKAIEVDSDSDDDDDESNQTSCLDDDDFDVNFGSMDDSLHNLKFMEVSEQHFRLIDNLDESFHDMSLQHLRKVDDDIDDSMVNEMSELRFRDIDNELDEDGTELVKQKHEIQRLIHNSTSADTQDDEEEKSSGSSSRSEERVVTADSSSTSSDATTEQQAKDNTAADDSTEWIPDTLCDAVVSSAEDISCHLVHPPDEDDEDENVDDETLSAPKKYELPGPFAFKNSTSSNHGNSAAAPTNMMKHPHPRQQKFGFGYPPPQQGFQTPFRPPPALAAQHQQNQVQQFATKANILTHSMSKSEHSRKLIDRFLKRTQRRHTIGRELQHSRMQVRKLIMDDLKFTTTNSMNHMKHQGIHFGNNYAPHPAMMQQNGKQLPSHLPNRNCNNNDKSSYDVDGDDHDGDQGAAETAQLEEQLKKQHALVEHQQKLVQQRYETLMRLKQEHSSMMQHRKLGSPSHSLGRAAQQSLQQQRSVA